MKDSFPGIISVSEIFGKVKNNPLRLILPLQGYQHTYVFMTENGGTIVGGTPIRTAHSKNVRISSLASIGARNQQFYEETNCNNKMSVIFKCASSIS